MRMGTLTRAEEERRDDGIFRDNFWSRRDWRIDR